MATPKRPKTKIICTIGPASCEVEQLRELIRAGMSVARLNFSHGDEATHREWIRRLREAADAEGFPLCIMQDLSGPKVRIGYFDGGKVFLSPGAEFTLTTRDVPGSKTEVNVPLSDLVGMASRTRRLMLSDGTIELRVIKASGTDVHCEVVVGGYLSDRKGISFPGLPLPLDPLTDKDRADLLIGIDEGVDYVALSFVQNHQNIVDLKELIKAGGSQAGVIAKLERPEALDDLEAIIEASDGVMVARGDLAIEIAPEKVPLAQKRVIREATRRGKYSITATQMLETMVHSQWPTRAEASDVANAVLDGTDAVMLSAETATGDHPVRVVEIMARIINATEEGGEQNAHHQRRQPGTLPVAAAIAQTVVNLSTLIHAEAICCFTSTGTTARLISKGRPEIPILGLSSHPETLRRINMGRGIIPLATAHVHGIDEMLGEVERAALDAGHAGPGDTLIITAGFPIGEEWGTNLVKVHRVGDA